MVYFYIDNCPSCDDSLSQLHKLYGQLDNTQVNLVKMDCDDIRSATICQVYHVREAPYMVLFHGDSYYKYDHRDGGFNSEAILDFIGAEGHDRHLYRKHGAIDPAHSIGLKDQQKANQ